MKHLLPFLAGLIAFMVISSVYYMGIVAYPSSACVVPEDQMQANFGMMLLGNALMVGLATQFFQIDLTRFSRVRPRGTGCTRG